MGLLREYRDSKKILGRHWPIIFFAEKRSDYQYLEHLLNLLIADHESICYLTADSGDPLLTQKRDRLHVFYSHNLLGHVFNHLKGDFVIMTMPDLQQFLFKRSPLVRQYVYVFHALVSTHQQYRPGAFDHYDTILCAGPHHIKELRAREQLQQLKAKELIPYGYPLLEKSNFIAPDRANPTILVAPSWYDQGILETCFDELMEQLKRTGLHTVIRFHPEFIKRRAKRYKEIEKKISTEKNFEIDQEIEVRKSLGKASMLITDRSGIAFEFALASGRPVFFIDTPPKLFNKEATSLGIEPMEDSYRSRIGTCIRPDELDKLPELIHKALEKGEQDFGNIKKELTFDISVTESEVKNLFKI